MGSFYRFDLSNKFSWLDKTYKKIQLKPQVRKQSGYDDCSHCSLVPAVETRNQCEWINRDEYSSKKELRIDMDLLKHHNPPPQNVGLMIKNIVDNFGGLIKAESLFDPWPFEIKSCLTFNIRLDNPNRTQDVISVIRHLHRGPVIGVFAVCSNYEHLRNPDLLYVGNRDYVPLNLQPGSPPLTHGVCIVGTVNLTHVNPQMNRSRIPPFAYQVLEPGLTIRDEDRIRYIFSSEIDYVFVPICS